MFFKKVLIGFLFLLVLNLTIIFSSSTLAYASVSPADNIKASASDESEFIQELPSESSQKDQEILEFKSEVIRLVNIERANNGVNELESMQILNNAGDVRAEESSVLFSHTRTDGSSNFTIFSDFSLIYRSAGENLGYGYRTPQKLVDAWMDSTSHRKNILSDRFDYIGIGYYMKENGKIYCSQIFYTPQETK